MLNRVKCLLCYFCFINEMEVEYDIMVRRKVVAQFVRSTTYHAIGPGFHSHPGLPDVSK